MNDKEKIDVLTAVVNHFYDEVRYRCSLGAYYDIMHTVPMTREQADELGLQHIQDIPCKKNEGE